MNLSPLCSSPQVNAYYDSHNEWLYVEWEGKLTLPVVQQACLQLARCILERPYARVLNNNTYVTGVDLNVGAWLVLHFMPHLALAGVRQMAWVCSPTLAGLNLVQTILQWLPRLETTIFTDTEDAVRWLQQRPPAPAAEAARSLATQARLLRAVADMQRAATAIQLVAPSA